MKIVKMHLMNGSSKTAALFDVETDENITIKGFRLVNGPKGLFLGIPSQRGKDDKYYESVILPDNLRLKYEKSAVEEYKKLSQSLVSDK